MEFKTGKFVSLRATGKIHLGLLSMDLPENAVVQFDGTTLKYGGKEHSIPSISSAVTQGWLVPVSDKESHYVAKPAGVRVRPAASAGKDQTEPMTMEAASEDERLVGNLATSGAKRKEALEKSRATTAAATTAKAVAAPKGKVAAKGKIATVPQAKPPKPVEAKARVTLTTPPPTEIKYPVVAEAEDAVVTRSFSGTKASKEAASSEGVAIAKIKTPTHQKVVVDDASVAQRAIRELDETPPPKPLKVKSSTVAVGEDIRKVHASGATGDVDSARSGEDLSSLLPDAASSGTPKTRVTEGNDWGWDAKAGHWKTRVAKAVEKYGSDPATLKQIYKLESPEVVKHIKEELAKRAKKAKAKK